MQAGATLGRRFTLLHPEEHDLPGVERWVAHDSRREVDVTVDIITSIAPTAVRKAAVRAAQVRDARFARVLASGRETVDAERITYVVTERPGGLAVAAIAGRRVIPVDGAAAVVGEAARALETASALDIHHGHVRAEALAIMDAGRVVISGLDADGELATQAGVGKGHSEHADAMALGRLFLTLVTGMPAEDVTVPDLPEGLSLRAADMARAAIAGTGPSTLAEVSRAAGPADGRALRRLRGTLGSLPLAPGAEPAAAVVASPAGAEGPLVVTADALAAAEHEALRASAVHHASAQVADEVRGEHVATGEIEVRAADGNPVDGAVPVPPEVAARFSRRTRRLAARNAEEPLGLETWEEIASRQNAEVPPSMLQAVLEWLERRWPGSATLGAAADSARHRAQREAPINAGPVMIGVFVAAMIVITLVALSMLREPIDPDFERYNNPPADYPDFTFSPEPLPSPSGDADGDE